jgi:hypothetical protein
LTEKAVRAAKRKKLAELKDEVEKRDYKDNESLQELESRKREEKEGNFLRKREQNLRKNRIRRLERLRQKLEEGDSEVKELEREVEYDERYKSRTQDEIKRRIEELEKEGASSDNKELEYLKGKIKYRALILDDYRAGKIKRGKRRQIGPSLNTTGDVFTPVEQSYDFGQRESRLGKGWRWQGDGREGGPNFSNQTVKTEIYDWPEDLDPSLNTTGDVFLASEQPSDMTGQK